MTEYDEYGTPLDRETFMKEIENFYTERSLEFKPPKFYGEPLNCEVTLYLYSSFGCAH